MKSNEIEWIEYAKKWNKPMFENCDFCQKTLLSTELELLASWLFRINNLQLKPIKFTDVSLSICVDCKTDCLENPDAFKFKHSLGLL